MLSEIPGSCIVFDEVHTYDPALAGLTLATARLFAKVGAKLMFISATLPNFLQKKIQHAVTAELVSPDPESKSDREVLDRKRHVVTVMDRSLLELVPDIVKAANEGQHVLVVCNHVRSSQQIAKLVRNELGDDEAKVSLFHGRFNMRDRKTKERTLATGPLPSVLVATQVIEVSLDLSFSMGFFEAAPIDALAQRMGRVNRQAKTGYPARIVIAQRTINPHRLYDSDRTADTLEALAIRTGPLSEEDIVGICNQVYRNGYTAEEEAIFDERFNYPPIAEFEEHIVSGQHKNWIEKIIEERSGRGDVLPRECLMEYKDLTEKKQWLDADALLVNNVYLSGIRDFLEPKRNLWIANLQYGKNGLEVPGN